MDGLADAAGIRLSDPAAPINPEQVAQALGELLDRRHGDGPAGAAYVRVPRYAAQLLEHIEVQPDAPVESGPYLGRSRHDLARLATETVDALGASWDTSAKTVPALTLDDVWLQRDGSLTIVGDLAWSDRHLELARVAVGLATRFGPAVVAPFLDTYGLERVDLRRLDTCQMLSMLADDVGFRPTFEGP